MKETKLSKTRWQKHFINLLTIPNYGTGAGKATISSVKMHLMPIFAKYLHAFKPASAAVLYLQSCDGHKDFYFKWISDRKCLNSLSWVTFPPRHLHSSMLSPPPRSLPRTASRAKRQRRTCSAAGTSGTPWDKTDVARGRLLIRAMHVSKSFTDIRWINALFFFFFYHSHFSGSVDNKSHLHSCGDLQI